MKTMSCFTISMLLVSLATNAWAATIDTSQTYTSGVLVLLFVGFCALIVVVQLIPALVMLYGWIKGLLTPAKLEAKSYHRQ